MTNVPQSGPKQTETVPFNEKLGYDTGHIELWRLEYAQRYMVEDAGSFDNEGEDINISIRCTLDEGKSIIVTSNIGVVTKTLSSVDVKAAYSVIIDFFTTQTDNAFSTAIVESVFYSSIWPRFCDLFVMLNSQARTEDVSLPRRPGINSLVLEEPGAAKEDRT